MLRTKLPVESHWDKNKTKNIRIKNKTKQQKACWVCQGILGFFQQCSVPATLVWGLPGPSFQPHLGCYYVFECMVYHLEISESWVVRENNNYLFSDLFQNLLLMSHKFERLFWEYLNKGQLKNFQSHWNT